MQKEHFIELGDVVPSIINALSSSALGRPRLVSPGDTIPGLGLLTGALSTNPGSLLRNILFGGVTFDIFIFFVLTGLCFGVLCILF